MTIARINKTLIRIKEHTKQKLSLTGYDELNVIRQVQEAYDLIDKTFRSMLNGLFVARSKEVYEWIANGKEIDDTVDELAELHIIGLLEDLNPVTHYSYATELLRKRDRAIEAINSSATKAEKGSEFDKAIRFLSQMFGWYTDFTEEDATITTMEKAGVERVVRHEIDDEKTCAECRSENGRTYAINKIPPLPHPRCRRWFTPQK